MQQPQPAQPAALPGQGVLSFQEAHGRQLDEKTALQGICQAIEPLGLHDGLETQAEEKSSELKGVGPVLGPHYGPNL